MPICSTRPAFMTTHAVGQLQRLLLVVRHEDAGEVDLVVQAAEPVAAAPAAPWRRARRTARRAAAPSARSASARASATRCRCPPESCAESGSPCTSSCTSFSSSIDLGADLLLRGRRARGRTRRPKATFSNTDHVPEQRVVLEDEADLALARRRDRSRPRRGI